MKMKLKMGVRGIICLLGKLSIPAIHGAKFTKIKPTWYIFLIILLYISETQNLGVSWCMPSSVQSFATWSKKLCSNF